MRLKAPMTPEHFNRVLKVLLSLTTIAVGMAAISGVTYIAASFVIAQLAAQHKESKPTRSPIVARERIASGSGDRLQAPDSLAEGSAEMWLDRAMRLAVRNQFQAAIAEASKISSSSVLYQQAQQSINLWSEQVLQKDAEQRDAQQRLQSEQESNQQHLQLAQQALNQNDWSTALQEAKQISNDPLWQQQKKEIIDQAEPVEHEQKANKFLAQGEFNNAMNEARRLSDAVPWGEKRKTIIDQAERGLSRNKSAAKRDEFCRQVSKEYIGECPNPDDLVAVGEKLSPLHRIVELIPLSHKPKR